MLEPIRHGLTDIAGVGRIRAAVQLGAVAGRDDEGFLDAGHACQFAQRFRQLLTREYDFFADIDGRGAVIDAYDDE